MPCLASRLRALRAAEINRIVLDLRRVPFADSCALRLMLAWSELAEREGFAFRLVSGPPPVQRLFEITMTTGTFDFLAPSELATAPRSV